VCSAAAHTLASKHFLCDNAAGCQQLYCLCWVRRAERTLSYAGLTIVLPLFHAVLLMVQPRKSSLPQQQQHNDS
jgi:hypothetical protein